jgi:uncharacterized membrane protein SpoIIM required for sporulation
MIIDLKKFIACERPFWNEMEALLSLSERDPYRRMSFEEIKRLHYLYQRASSDLARISTFSAERAMTGYLEAMVSRAYAIIHAGRQERVRFSFWRWFWGLFPQTFRRRRRAFALALAILLAGALFGAAAIALDPQAKSVLMPFEHLQMDPAKRVAMEEAPDHDRLKGAKGSFAAFLMTHNTRISVLVLALGMTWGVGTVLLLFSNGVMLGAVAADYIRAGQSVFLVGWLLPHGAVEIPSVLLAGQAGLLLAGAMIGRRSARNLGARLRLVVPDVVTLISGVAVMLVWAGIVEGFFSQYHAPVIPYAVKISFGCVELALLAGFFCFSGRRGVSPLTWRRIGRWFGRSGRRRPPLSSNDASGRPRSWDHANAASPARDPHP